MSLFRPDVLPARGAEVLTAVRGFASDSPAAMTAEERAAWLFTLQQISDATAAYRTEVLGAFDANGDGETLHAARSTNSWLKGALQVSGTEAARQVRLARASRTELAQALRAMREGEINYEQLGVIGRSVADLPVEQTEAAVGILTELATQAGVADVAAAGQQIRQAVNPDGALAACENDFSRRHMYLSPLLDGMYTFSGILDAEGAAVLNTALQPFLVPTDTNDDRDAPQRRADGLVSIASLALDQGLLPKSGGSKATLNVTTTLHALQARGGFGGRVESTGGVVGSATMQRIACDAAVARVLLDGEHIPVELGRAQRLFSPQQRKLLALRDGGCRFPGCGLPPAFTDAHHLHPWQSGGDTNLVNGLLVCRWHHRHLHEGGWWITPDDPLRGANGTLTFDGPKVKRLRSKPRAWTQAQLEKLTWWDEPPD